jgi:hypothetical protein
MPVPSLVTNLVQTGKKELLFDASHAKHSPPKARPLSEQDGRESQKLWHDVTEAVKRRDQEVATDAKAKVEDMQREETAKRNADGVEWQPQLFRAIRAGMNGAGEGEEDLEWIINAKVSVASSDEGRRELTKFSDAKSPDEIIQQILAIHAILPGQKPEHQFDLPSRPKAHEQSNQPTEHLSTSQNPTPQPSASQPSTLQQSAPQSFVHQETVPQQSPIQSSAPRESAPQLSSPQPPLSQPSPQPSQAQSAQSQPGTFLQYSQSPVGNLDGSSTQAPSHSLVKGTFASDPSNPSVVPHGKPMARPNDDISESMREQIARELPPSKLLNSNPEVEPHRNDTLRRKDSETLEVEEFVDALT